MFFLFFFFFLPFFSKYIIKEIQQCFHMGQIIQVLSDICVCYEETLNLCFQLAFPSNTISSRNVLNM